MIEVPLQTVDNIMLEMHLGHVLVGGLVLAILGSIPLKSMKIIGLTLTLFGSVFIITPVDAAGDTILFRLLGVALIIVGPMLYATAR